jgi:protein-tyrosine phosphatase
MEVVPLEKISTFDHIVGNLYLGDVESATSSNIANYNIEIVVNVSKTRYELFDGVEYHRYDIDDESSENISEYFDRFIALIENNPTKHILVHCQNSVSRSVTLVLAYLIKSGKTLVEAFEYLKSKRTQYTCPNRGFIKQLSSYEMSVRGVTSIDPIVLYKALKK